MSSSGVGRSCNPTAHTMPDPPHVLSQPGPSWHWGIPAQKLLLGAAAFPLKEGGTFKC